MTVVIFYEAGSTSRAERRRIRRAQPPATRLNPFELQIAPSTQLPFSSGLIPASTPAAYRPELPFQAPLSLKSRCIAVGASSRKQPLSANIPETLAPSTQVGAIVPAEKKDLKKKDAEELLDANLAP